MFRAAVPEATVHKNRDSAFCEHKIRTPKETYVASPPYYSVAAKKCNQSQLRGLIAPPANMGHDLRALGRGKNVSHTDPQFLAFAFL